MADGKDYSHWQCPAGTTDIGVTTHKVKQITMRLCTFEGKKLSSTTAPRVLQFIKEARAAGKKVTISSGVRTYEEQVALYHVNCGRGVCRPPTAKPGTSNHEGGVAIDWGLSGSTWCFPDGKTCVGNAGYDYMVANGAKYDFHKLPSEAWHWSMNGK